MTGEELKTLIRMSGWKQGDVAKELGMSAQNFSAKFKSTKIASDLVERVQEIVSRPINGNVSVGGDANNTNINSTTLDGEVLVLVDVVDVCLVLTGLRPSGQGEGNQRHQNDIE